MDILMDINGFFQTVYWGSTIGQYILFALIVIGSFLVGKTIYFFFKYEVRKVTKKTNNRLDDLLLDIIEEPLVVLIVIFGVWTGVHQLTLESGLLDFLNSVFGVLVSLNIVWFILRLADVIIIEYLKPFAKRNETALDDELIPILQKVVKGLILIFAILSIVSNFGYDLTAIVTGLGIGGIAIALAAQDTLGNLFGGISLFMDRPFGIGDRVKVGDVYGDVVDVGMRSSKIETLDNTVVTIPNSVLSKSNIENYVKPDTILKQKFTMGLTYNTPVKKIERAVEIVRDVIKKTEGVADREPLIWFTEFGASSLNILVIYWIKSLDFWGTTKHDMNIEIKGRFEKEGIEFAYPTQTIYLEKTK
ncbi:MAG: mechanosensitive ion channel family protein [Candidatus Altiarchaeota archaeon]|nr:mechanosensitive ion channel family protein [Candidatus Altiarchaeota archaeon]